MKSLPVLLFTLFAEIATPAAFAQENDPAKAERVATRVYDIRDLLMQRRSYPAQSALVPPTRLGEERPTPPIVYRPTTQPDGSGGGGGGAASAPPTAGDEIRSLMQETVDPESWRDNGGSVGAMRELDGQLIVSQTATNHEQIVHLLAQLRETSARMVTIRAHWIFLKPTDLKAVAKPLASDPALFAVDFAAVEKLGAVRHYQGQVTSFNTQTVHVASGDARTVITDYDSNTGGGDNAVGYDARASVVQAGMTLEVTPVLTPDAGTVMLDVQSVVSDWGSSPGDNPRRGQPTTMPTAIGVPGIDHVQMLVQQLRTTVALPVGKPVIIGGMTFSPWVPEKDEQLYLVIEASASGNSDAPKPRRDGGDKTLE